MLYFLFLLTSALGTIWRYLFLLVTLSGGLGLLPIFGEGCMWIVGWYRMVPEKFEGNMNGVCCWIGFNRVNGCNEGCNNIGLSLHCTMFVFKWLLNGRWIVWVVAIPRWLFSSFLVFLLARFIQSIALFLLIDFKTSELASHCFGVLSYINLIALNF